MSDLDIHLTFLFFNQFKYLTSKVLLNNYFIFAVEVSLTIKTMDSPLISCKRHLFALSIVDGALDDMDEERRNEIILAITEIKEEMLNDYHAPKSAE